MNHDHRERITVPRGAQTAALRHTCDTRVDGASPALQYRPLGGSAFGTFWSVEAIVPMGTTEWRCPACGLTFLIDWEELESTSLTRAAEEVT